MTLLFLQINRDKIIFISLFLLFSISLQAQKNVIKGSALYIPRIGEIFRQDRLPLRIAYERFFNAHWSAQIGYEYTRYDIANQSLSIYPTRAAVVESRYYLNRKNDIKKSFFIGAYGSYWREKRGQGSGAFYTELTFPEPPLMVTLSKTQNTFLFGLEAGKNFSLKRNFYVEPYLGGGYYFLFRQYASKTDAYGRFRFRAGINLCYMF